MKLVRETIISTGFYILNWSASNSDVNNNLVIVQIRVTPTSFANLYTWIERMKGYAMYRMDIQTDWHINTGQVVLVQAQKNEMLLQLFTVGNNQLVVSDIDLDGAVLIRNGNDLYLKTTLVVDKFLLPPAATNSQYDVTLTTSIKYLTD